MTVTRRLAAILAADCDEISETGLLMARPGLSLTSTRGPQSAAKRMRTKPT